VVDPRSPQAPNALISAAGVGPVTPARKDG